MATTTQQQQLFKDVCIAGATGKVGQRIVQTFLDKKTYNVKLLVSGETENKQLVEEFKSKGAHVECVDYSKKSDLVNVFKGCQLVISALGSAGLKFQVNLIEAAREAGVKRFVPSEFGMDIDKAKSMAVFESKLKSREALEKSGMEWTYILSGFFMEFPLFTPDFGFDVANGKVPLYDHGTSKLTVTSIDDWTKIVPEILNHPSSKNSKVGLAGETLTWNEAIEVFEKASGKKFQREPVTVADLEKQIKENPSYPTFSKQLQWCLANGLGVIERPQQSEFTSKKFKTLQEYANSLCKK